MLSKACKVENFKGGVCVVEWLCLICTAVARMNRSKPLIAAGSACRTFGNALPRYFFYKYNIYSTIALKRRKRILDFGMKIARLVHGKTSEYRLP